MQPLFPVFLALLLAHLVGDFPLQTAGMLRRKRSGIVGYAPHGGIHYVLALGAIAALTTIPLTWRLGLILLVYVIVHLSIDAVRAHWIHGSNRDSAAWFVGDQILHVATVAIATIFICRIGLTQMAALSMTRAAHEKIAAVGIVYAVGVFASGYLIRYLTESLAQPVEGETSEELVNAGLYIGWLERFLVITALVVQSPAMVGLILTGKSIARVPELKAPRFAEYFLIGTLLSLAIAVLSGLILVAVLYGTVSLK